MKIIQYAIFFIVLAALTGCGSSPTAGDHANSAFANATDFVLSFDTAALLAAVIAWLNIESKYSKIKKTPSHDLLIFVAACLGIVIFFYRFGQNHWLITQAIWFPQNFMKSAMVSMVFWAIARIIRKIFQDTSNGPSDQ